MATGTLARDNHGFFVHVERVEITSALQVRAVPVTNIWNTQYDPENKQSMTVNILPDLNYGPVRSRFPSKLYLPTLVHFMDLVPLSQQSQ